MGVMREVPWSLLRQPNYVDPPACVCKHFYVSIDDGKYVEKCVLCDEPKA